MLQISCQMHVTHALGVPMLCPRNLLILATPLMHPHDIVTTCRFYSQGISYISNVSAKYMKHVVNSLFIMLGTMLFFLTANC